MSEAGWIKLHRCIKDWRLYKNVNARLVFIHLLLTADYDNGTCSIHLSEFSEACGLSVQSVRTALKNIEAEGAITVNSKRGNSGGICVVIHNWEKYQSGSKKQNQHNDQHNEIDKINTMKTSDNTLAINELQSVENTGLTQSNQSDQHNNQHNETPNQHNESTAQVIDVQYVTGTQNASSNTMQRNIKNNNTHTPRTCAHTHVEEQQQTETASQPVVLYPNVDEYETVVNAAACQGVVLDKEEAVRFIEYWSAVGWRRNGALIRDWRYLLRRWGETAKKIQQTTGVRNGNQKFDNKSFGSGEYVSDAIPGIDG